MGYTGNQPAANFVSVVKDTFNGNASSYTLSKAATTNGVAVYVENVRQIPTTAYSVSGTTLTFTGTTPAGTGNVYVLHHNAPASTATHPAAQALTATSGTFTGDVSIDGGSFVFNESSADKDFRVESNGNANMLFVDGGDDRVGIGVTPTNTLTASAAVNTYVARFNNTVGSGNVFMHLWRFTTAPNDDTSTFLYCDDENGANQKMRVNSNGNVKNANNSYGATSDERVKQNITDANSQWDDIKALKVRNFKKKDDVRQYGTDEAPIHLGLVAQEVETVSPKLVDGHPPSVGEVLSSSEFGTLEDDLENPKSYYEDGDTIPNGKKVGDAKEYNKKVKEEKAKVKGIKYSILYMKAVKALQEAMTRIETLEAKVKTLEDA